MKYYFLGIGGTAMAALAVLLKQRGHDVWGSDKGIYPPMSDFLAEHKIDVIEGFSADNLKRDFDVAVIGNALSRGNPEVEAILADKHPFTCLPEIIRHEFAVRHKNIVVTGTHGKTTTTSLMSWVLQHGKMDPTFLIGGIAKNFDSSIQNGSGDYFVIEGDEYDCAFFDKRPKFIHYFPDYLILNNIEFDHADIYPDLESIKNEFRKLLRIVPENGLVVANAESPAVMSVVEKVCSRLETFGRSRENDWSYEIVEMGRATRFDLLQKGQFVQQFEIPFPGEFQVQNAVAVCAVAHSIGLDWQTIGEALSTFEGVKRRMEFWGKLDGADVYDDFAHHPTAIGATLAGVKQKFPGRRLVALFEPRTNTTVRNIFQDDLVTALAEADASVVTPIHRAERMPVEQRLSLTALADALGKKQHTAHLVDDYQKLIPELRQQLRDGDVLILLTNGSLGGQYKRLRDLVQVR
ncbi:MAG: UDP-N-acetylmuramate:L-alanyl-gamma-D-glutamyl-meso-diaminopimelate ligase [Calditrichia bacterium]